ncbi:MAG: class I SAM-dependent methyltransferase [Planctomycetia bacterium]|nr:class I SAM-dependent methyltransferase [Planctomycetia bacterium]
MFARDQYLLLDFGNGRRLEQWNGFILDRLCPAVTHILQTASTIWKTADARFIPDSNLPGKKGNSERGNWIPLTEKGHFFLESTDFEVLTLRCDLDSSQQAQQTSFFLELKGSPFGHLGVFPEQMPNWEYIYRYCRTAQKQLGRRVKILNLFAYTGASSLAAAMSGADVVHLDAARNIVIQAQKNANLTEQQSSTSLSIRFIADDVLKFVRRELKRQNEYDGIILDPPSYGHGTRGEVWRISRDLPKLLNDCISLLSDPIPFLLLTSHTPGFHKQKLSDMLQDSIRQRYSSKESQRFLLTSNDMFIRSQYKKNLPSGQKVLLSTVDHRLEE